jgi:YidC/Oxa1 family membrane protein insertase
LENRVLLAFILSLFVFFGWGYFLSVVQEPPAGQTDTAAKNNSPSATGTSSSTTGTGAVKAPEAGQTEPEEGETAGAEVIEGTETLVRVMGNGVEYDISSQGATLRKVLLKRYHNDQGDTVDLVRHDGRGSWPLAIESNDSEMTRLLQKSHYEPSTESLTLSAAEPTGTVTMRLKHPSGVEVERIFTFQYDQPLIGVETHIKAPALAAKNLQYQVLWGPSMGGRVESQTDYIVFSGPTAFVNNERIENDPEDISGDIVHTGDLKWTAFQNKYFAVALVPETGIKAGLVKKDADRVYIGLQMEAVQSNASTKHLVYAGTKQLQVLEDTGHKLVRLIDYGWLGNKFAFLVKPLLKTLQYFYGITQNYGWSIVILTLIIKVLFFPLTHKSFKSMKGMQKIQPYVKVIQERNKDDRQKMNEELLELYKKHKVNPLGGCLPMLLQIPVFIGLYHALFFSIELKGAPFFGWIQDLSVADPYYVTPMLMGATMFLQQKLTPTTGDPVQQKIMMFLPIVFTFLFISFPAGLVIYWTVNNILTISQQFYIYRIAKDS